MGFSDIKAGLSRPRLEQRFGLESTKTADESELTKFPDEDMIEDVQTELFRIAWREAEPSGQEVEKTVKRLGEVLFVWTKILASEKLSEIMETFYLGTLGEAADSKEVGTVLQQIDLVICFFHHYIYAFEEFVNRRFRDAVIRCGLICERVVKRLAMASMMPQVLEIPKFEDKVGKLRSQLEGKCGVIDDLANFLQYVYRQRTARGAHDTTAATALIAKSCMTSVTTIYMLYLDVLDCVGQKVEPRNELEELVNSTISTGTSLVVSKEGRPVKPEQVIESLYKGQFLKEPKSLAEIGTELRKLGYTFPSTTLFRALGKFSGREGILLKKGKRYVQRVPPEEYFRKEIIS